MAIGNNANFVGVTVLMDHIKSITENAIVPNLCTIGACKHGHNYLDFPGQEDFYFEELHFSYM